MHSSYSIYAKRSVRAARDTRPPPPPPQSTVHATGSDRRRRRGQKDRPIARWLMVEMAVGKKATHQQHYTYCTCVQTCDSVSTHHTTTTTHKCIGPHALWPECVRACIPGSHTHTQTARARSHKNGKILIAFINDNIALECTRTRARVQTMCVSQTVTSCVYTRTHARSPCWRLLRVFALGTKCEWRRVCVCVVRGFL